jgi:hypothetical protein
VVVLESKDEPDIANSDGGAGGGDPGSGMAWYSSRFADSTDFGDEAASEVGSASGIPTPASRLRVGTCVLVNGPARKFIAQRV